MLVIVWLQPKKNDSDLYTLDSSSPKVGLGNKGLTNDSNENEPKIKVVESEIIRKKIIMRHFIVLGFTTNSKAESGENLYLGSDRSEAVEAVNTPEEQFVRKELYELAVPHIRRHRPVEAIVPDDPDNSDQLSISGGAKRLITEKQLADDDIAKIVPTGAKGNIVKGDVERYLEQSGD